jgi:hypothetical protein
MQVGLTPAALDGGTVLDYAFDALPHSPSDGSTTRGVLLQRL